MNDMKRWNFSNILAAAGILAISCHDNQIHFDLKDQSIKTCNGREIGTLYIQVDNGDLWEFRKESGQDGTNHFVLDSLNLSYQLIKGTVQLPLDSFMLLPSHKYVITNHTYGDAADSEIQIVTDSSGKVGYAHPTTCK